MMSTIYRKAANVTVWLGPDEHKDAPVLFGEFKALIEGCGGIIDVGGQFGHFDEETGDMHWQLENGQNIVSALPKAIGWNENGHYLGRPVDVQQYWDGSLLVSDDLVGAVYRIWYDGK